LKQLFYIQTDNAKEATHQILCIRVGDRHCSFAITDKQGTDLYSLAYYTAGEIDNNSLSEIFSGHAELNKSFSDVLVSYDYTKSVLVPTEYYDTDDAKTVLNTMYGVNGQSSSFNSEAVNKWQLYNVYAVPKDVHDSIIRKFPNAKYSHYYTLESKVMPAGFADCLLIDIHMDEFSVIAIKENKLLIAQMYSYSTPADVLYYLLKICEQFSLSQERVQLAISGLIEKESQLFNELYQYFLLVEFRVPAWKVPATEGYGYPAHFFTSLNDLARCAS
jgi:hypothetical protein